MRRTKMGVNDMRRKREDRVLVNVFLRLYDWVLYDFLFVSGTWLFSQRILTVMVIAKPIKVFTTIFERRLNGKVDTRWACINKLWLKLCIKIKKPSGYLQYTPLLLTFVSISSSPPMSIPSAAYLLLPICIPLMYPLNDKHHPSSQMYYSQTTNNPQKPQLQQPTSPIHYKS